MSTQHLIYSDPGIIHKWLEGQTIKSIMYGHRNNFEDEKMMCLSLCLENGQVIDLWAVPGDFEGKTLDEFHAHDQTPHPYLAVSRLDEASV